MEKSKEKKPKPKPAAIENLDFKWSVLLKKKKSLSFFY